MTQLFKRHTLISIYTLVFFGLLFGVYTTSGTMYFAEMFIYFAALLLFYLAFSTGLMTRFYSRVFGWFESRRFHVSSMILVVIAAAFIIFHLAWLGGSPTLKAMRLTTVEDVALLRTSITENIPSWIAYMADITLKAILPFLVLYLLHTRKMTLYWIILALGVFYAFSLLQKSYIIGIVLPAMIYCLAERRYLFALKYMLLIALVVFGLSFIANPGPTAAPLVIVENEGPQPDAVSVETEKYSKFERIAFGLYDRVCIVPGRVVSDWFTTIPEKKPFLHGDGYRVLALLRGREHRNYSIELYPVIQHEFAAQGFTGSVNVASFMYEYANFAVPGLVLSGFILALLFSVIEFFFRNNFNLKLGINLFPVLLLSSGAITTLLFSGGWGFLILFYLVFMKNKLS
jgi:hypothetical protein